MIRTRTRDSIALVLRAGLGTRLRPLTDVRAKPAIPVAGEPMIRRIAAWLVSHGVDDLVLNLHHRPETLTAVLGDGRDLGARVRYSWEPPQVLGSAGGPRLARPIVGADTFLIVNGDTLTDVDLAQLADAHAASGALVTLALVPNREFLRYGGVRARRGRTRHRIRPPRAGGRGLVSLHRRAGRRRPRSSTRVAPGAPASSIGGVYDALIASQPGAVRGVSSPTRRSATSARRPTTGARRRRSRPPTAGGSSAGRGARIDRVGARHAVDSVGRCGGGRRRAARRLHRHRRRARAGRARRTAATILVRGDDGAHARLAAEP